MQRLLDRLDRKLEWTLVAPQARRAMNADEGAADQNHAHPVLVQRILQLRAAMGLLPDQPEARHSFSAAGVWHLITTDAAGEIAGTVRLYVIDRQREPLEPADIARISHVEFPCERVREQHELVLQRLFDAKAQERFFVAPGGLFTIPAWRGSGLAAMLGAAAIAMARLFESRFSASYTAVRGQAQDIFTTFGGLPPLLPDGRPLAPFFCRHHGFELQILVFDSRYPGPRAEAGAHLMVQRLQTLMQRPALAA